MRQNSITCPSGTPLWTSLRDPKRPLACHEALRRIQISFPQGTGYVEKTVTFSW
jgi:hypothetical protein